MIKSRVFIIGLERLPRVLVGELKGCLVWLVAPFTIVGLL